MTLREESGFADSPGIALYDADTRLEHAREAGLRYVTDDMPGIRRQKRGKGFSYRLPDGERLTDPAALARINALAIPPAYREVWICPSPKGHLQATGRDARGRKQYRYHSAWMEYRNANKFARLAEFGEALPRIRERIAADMKGRQLSHARVMALVIALLDATAMRIGNDAYARENGTYGLTTLRKKHISIEGGCIRFEYLGKHRKQWNTSVCDRRLTRILRQCEELPGQPLFQYIDEAGERRSVRSEDVNGYLQAITGQPFTAKDFRTWTATTLAIKALLEEEEAAHSQTASTRQINAAVKRVAQEMGHTPAICRKCYIYPQVLSAFAQGALHAHFQVAIGQDREAFEHCVIALLRGEAVSAAAASLPA